jgi:peptidoglycan/xylan/chitin deacetylase (PgdA/CDA1 family)
MHDYTSGKNTTCDALSLIIPALLEKGYEFVTVSELIQN